MLIGRERECARIDELLDRARLGRSGALVIRGEAGIGKTALVDYAAERAADATVVRTLGVESEAELEFSALLEISRPLLAFLDELAEQQADALRAALRLGPPVALDRFAVGAATLSLLAAAAEARPLVVLADDGQWLDPASADALLFATRRLDADRVAVLFAARDADNRPFHAPGIEELRVGALSLEDAKTVLRSRGDIADGVAERLYEATRGNPLALVEVAALLPHAQLRGEEQLEHPLPVGAGVEHAFAGRARALPADAQEALLITAASTSSSLRKIVGALAALELDVGALEPAEAAGLVRVVDGRLEFRHPLVRSAVYQSAAASERRAAHRALADAGGDTDPEERAWHLAAATLGPDEDVAFALERVAEQAGRRSGFAAAASALERAARLTPDRQVAFRRLAAAAEATWRAGRTEATATLVAETLAGTSDAGVRGAALRLDGAIRYLAGEGDTVARSLLEAFELLSDLDPRAAVSAAADAVNVLIRIREPEQAVQTAERARSLASTDGSETDLEAAVALGFALSFAGRYSAAEPQLGRAVELFAASATIPGPLQAGRLAAALDWLGRYADGYRCFERAIGRARAAGAAGSLTHLLALAAWQALGAGHWLEAESDAGEALELADALGHPVAATTALGDLTWLCAFRGDESRCRKHAGEARERAVETGFTRPQLMTAVALGLLDLGAGRVDSAIKHLEGGLRIAEDLSGYLPGAAPQLDLVEAYARVGRTEDANATLKSLGPPLASAPLVAALAERCRGLLADTEHFETHFQEALVLHEAVESPFALARTRLCYGERLRRAGRRIDARAQLRAALEVFERLGARPWAERAHSELRASGETLRRRESHEAEQLTPQELQIALQVAEGKTNKEVGAALFLSHKTVEFHLGRIYRKLDVNSRAALIRRFATEPAAALSAP